MLYLKTIEDIKIIPYLDYDKKGLFADRTFLEEDYISLYKDKIYVSDYRHALYLMVNDVKNNNKIGRINTYQHIDLPEGYHFPINLSSSVEFIELSKRLNNYKNNSKVKILLLGGFGPAYGDNICGITALNIFEKELNKYFQEFQIDIYHVQSNKFKGYYSRFGIKLYQEPLELERFCEYDYYYDITSINSLIEYHQRSIVDSFLYMFSIDYLNISKEIKRIKYLFPENREFIFKTFLNNKGIKGEKVLFHPDSIQACRNIPIDISYNIIKEILDKTNVNLFTVTDISYSHPRFFNIKNISKEFDDFAEIISEMDKIVTVDTATYHVSDAFSVPTLVVFTNAGIKRISDYPNAKGYVVDQLFLDKLEEIRIHRMQHENEYDFIEESMPSVWQKFDNSKIIDFLLATE